MIKRKTLNIPQRELKLWDLLWNPNQTQTQHQGLPWEQPFELWSRPCDIGDANYPKKETLE